MEKEKLISHYGPLSYEEIGFLLNKMTTALSRYAFGITIKKKVYSAMVESLENIYKHQDAIPGSKDHLPKFSLDLTDDYICLSVSNPILRSKMPLLKDKLDKVNLLDKNGLKEYYKEVILSGNVSQSGGAGLGIINIAKVTENTLDYSFEDIDPGYAYFTLNIKVLHNTPQQ